MRSEQGKVRDAGPVDWRPSNLWSTAVIVLFLLGVVNTYIAVQGKTKANQSLAISSQALPAFKELKQQYGEIHHQLAALQQQQLGMTASFNTTGLNQIKQELEATVVGALQNVTRSAADLLPKAATIDAQLLKLQQRIDAVASTATPPPPPPPQPAAPSEVITELKELQHVATHHNICHSHGASGLKLDITDDLIAPVVIVAYNRVGYLARSFIGLMK
jgi:hypothetical protein